MHIQTFLYLGVFESVHALFDTPNVYNSPRYNFFVYQFLFKYNKKTPTPKIIHLEDESCSLRGTTSVY